MFARISDSALILKRVVTLFSMTLCAGLFSQVYAASYDYTAISRDNAVDLPDVVQAGSLTWKCDGNSCQISEPWQTPGLAACRALAQMIGPIASYGHPGEQLSDDQIAQCNRDATVAASSRPLVGQIIAPVSANPESGGRTFASQLS